ncbi:MAG TPA: type II restriction endonuclease [Candidatus Angelobacter sp.]|jgi:hypothetical protein
MASSTQAQVLEQLKASFYGAIPSGITIAERAVSRALAGRRADPKWIKRNFSTLVEQVQKDAYRVYLEAEKSAARKAFTSTFLPRITKTANPKEVILMLGNNFYALDKFFLSLTQGRRPRAGGAFELLIRRLFLRLGYPFTLRPIINGQPDFVLPSIDHFEAHAMGAIIFTAKRSLRERWRQIVTEGTRGLGFFLATIDEKVAKRDLKEMRTSRISLVVPTNVKICRADYKEAANVITFEDFFQFHLDPAMKRWRARKVI